MNQPMVFSLQQNEFSNIYLETQRFNATQTLEEKCKKLKYVSLYLLCLFVVSLLFNLVLLICFMKNKSLRSAPQNTFVIALCTLNLVGTLSELPPTMTSSFSCRWLWGYQGCILSGFVMYWIGCSSIYLLVALSIERFYIIYEPLTVRYLNRAFYVKSVVACLLLGLIWPLLPVFGWSHYSFEGFGTSCSVEWSERSMNVISYNITILICVFFIPLLILVYTNVKLIYILNAMNSRQRNKISSQSMQKKILLERLLTVITITLIVSFMVSWVPYAAVCIWTVLGGHVTPFASTLPAMFAKSSLLWTSVLYFITNKNVRSKAIKLFFNKKSRQMKQSDSATFDLNLTNHQIDVANASPSKHRFAVFL